MKDTGYCDKYGEKIYHDNLIRSLNNNELYRVRFMDGDEEPFVYLEKFKQKRKKAYIPMSWLNYSDFVIEKGE